MGDYEDIGVQFSSTKNVANFISNNYPNKTGIYTVSIRSKHEADQFLKLVSAIKEKCSIVFEEASKFCNPKSIPDAINNLIHYGRHYQMNLVFTARRAAELHRSVTSQSTAIVSFQQTEPNDITILKKVFHEAKRLPDLVYNPVQPEKNEYIVMGNTTLIE